MANITLAWEMGGGFGHITRLDNLARNLHKSGHQVTLVAKASNTNSLFFAPSSTLPYTCLTAPEIPAISPQLTRKPANFSEVLLCASYYDAALLAKAIQAWQNIFETLRPDLVIFDAAPTAMLAARGLNSKKINLGCGYFLPPRTQPLPQFDMGKKIAIEALMHSEAKLLAIVNSALAQCKQLPLSAVHEIFHCDSDILLTFNELDIYSEHRNTSYYGYLSDIQPAGKDAGIHWATIPWTTTPGIKKILGYLKADYAQLPNLLHALSGLECEAHIFVPGISEENYRHHQKHRVHISAKPFALEHCITSADLMLCHGGHTTAAIANAHGVATAIIPLQQEQFLTAQRSIDKHLGCGINPFATSDDMQNKICRVLNSERHQAALQQMREKYASQTSQGTMQRVLDECEALL